jgi:hypothetical protein
MSGLDLIDWGLVGFSALWILGASLLLATFSVGYYVAQERRTRTLLVIKRRRYRLALNGGLALFALGMAGNAATWWERLLSAILTLVFAYQTYRSVGGRG